MPQMPCPLPERHLHVNQKTGSHQATTQAAHTLQKHMCSIIMGHEFLQPGAAVAKVRANCHQNGSDDGAVNRETIWHPQEGRGRAPKEGDSREEESDGEGCLFKRFQANRGSEYSADSCHCSERESARDHREPNEDAADQALSGREYSERGVAQATRKRGRHACGETEQQR